MNTRRNHVWIVESQMEHERRFTPTVGCKLTRAEGREELREWQKRNPDDRFRLTKYIQHPLQEVRA